MAISNPRGPSADLDIEKHPGATTHHEDIHSHTPSSDHDGEVVTPPGYFRSRFFVGTMAAIGLGLMAGVAGFGYAAPILGIINADIGPVRILITLHFH